MRPAAPMHAQSSGDGAVRLPLARLTRHTLALRCPLCGKDKPFHGLFGMHRSCRTCGYVFAREDGYFLGSADVNFWVTFCLLVPFVLIGYLLFRGPWIAVSLAFTVVFPVWFFRYSKALYMLLDLALDPPTEADFTVREPRHAAPATGRRAMPDVARVASLVLALPVLAFAQASPAPSPRDALRAWLLAPPAGEAAALAAARTALGSDLAKAVGTVESLPPLTEAKPGTQHGVRFASGGHDWELSIRLPAGYDGKKRFPVLVLPDHGSVDAEAGIGFWEQSELVERWILFRPVILRQKEDRGRFPDQQFFAIDQAIAAVMRDALRHLRLHYAVDHDRLVMTGLSQAGYYTWYFALTLPDEFAAIVPESAGGMGLRAQSLLAPNLRHVAVRILHAEADQITPYADAKLMLGKLEALGAAVELVTYQDKDWPGEPPPKRHPGPHHLRLRHVLEWGLEAKRQIPDRIERVLRYRQQGREARFRIEFTPEPTKPLTVQCSATKGKLEADAPGVTYLVPPAELLAKRVFTTGGKKMTPKPDLELLLRSLKEHGDPRRLAAAAIPIQAK